MTHPLNIPLTSDLPASVLGPVLLQQILSQVKGIDASLLPQVDLLVKRKDTIITQLGSVNVGIPITACGGISGCNLFAAFILFEPRKDGSIYEKEIVCMDLNSNEWRGGLPGRTFHNVQVMMESIKASVHTFDPETPSFKKHEISPKAWLKQAISIKQEWVGFSKERVGTIKTAEKFLSTSKSLGVKLDLKAIYSVFDTTPPPSFVLEMPVYHFVFEQGEILEFVNTVLNTDTQNFIIHCPPKVFKDLLEKTRDLKQLTSKEVETEYFIPKRIKPVVQDALKKQKGWKWHYAQLPLGLSPLLSFNLPKT